MLKSYPQTYTTLATLPQVYALGTDSSENEETPKQRTGNKGDEFRVLVYRAGLIDTLSRGIDRGRAFLLNTLLIVSKCLLNGEG